VTSETHSAILKALRILRSRDVTRAEMLLLLKPTFDDHLIQEAIVFLDQYQLLDDLRIVRNRVEKNTGRHAVGDGFLKEKLRAKGVSEDLISLVFEQIDTSEAERAAELLQLKFKQSATRAKAARYLWARGFSEDTIESVIGSIPEEEPEQ
jgi:SOS response regulatory protein OraA/RecX